MSYSIAPSFLNSQTSMSVFSPSFGMIRQACSKAVSTLSSIKESMVGRAIQKVVKENIYEGIGSETVVACVTKAVKWISSSDQIRSQVILPSVLKVVASYFGGGFVTQGAFFTAGVLGGYLGVRLSGSDEKLVDEQDLFASYAVKASQGYLLSAWVESSLGLPQGLLGTVAKFGIEALGFNVRDIVRVTQRVANKNMFTNLFPEHPEKLLASKVFEQLAGFVKLSLRQDALTVVSEKYIQNIISLFLRFSIDFHESVKLDHELSTVTQEFENAYRKYAEETDFSQKEEQYKNMKASKLRLYQKMRLLLVKDKKPSLNNFSTESQASGVEINKLLKARGKIEEVILENVQKWLEDFEKNICGIFLSSKEKVAVWFELLKAYLQLAFECIDDASIYVTTKCELAQDEVKKLYQVTSSVILSFYQDKLGRQVARFLDKQFQGQF